MATAASLVHKEAKNGEQKWEPTKATQVGCIAQTSGGTLWN
jgi:hypothetical protein